MAPEPRAPARSDAEINLSWLIRLRWGAVAAQCVLVAAVAGFFSIEVPWLPVGALLALELSSNLAVALLSRGRPALAQAALPALLTLDVALFTVLLFLTGGTSNPFSFLYLVYIALGAVVLRPLHGWALAVLAMALFGSLFLVGEEPSGHMAHMALHLKGMWVAFDVAAGFIVYFVQRVTRALVARDAELLEARARAAKQERLASLATLAAGAAHELGSPLGTIAVAAKELERTLGGGAGAGDAQLIRAQVDRCRAILSQMAADAGAAEGEPEASLQLTEWVERSGEGLEGRERLDLLLPVATVVGPPRALVHALRGVLKNALQAAPAERVQVSLERKNGSARLVVRDRGPGMSAAVLARASEPFFTTKSPGEGMGLGLYLTRSVVEQLGGTLELSSQSGEGTTAVLSLPGATIRGDKDAGDAP